MAIIHQATLKPSKLEMLSAYLATQPYTAGLDLSELSAIGAYRFDDPAGAVGIETHLLATPDVPVIQVPVTYRGEPLDGAEDWLLGVMEHSVLGSRWVYNGCADPVYVAELARVILTGGSQVGLFVETDDGPVEREPTVFVSGSGPSDATVPTIDAVVVTTEGTETAVQTAGLEIVVRHVVGESAPAGAMATLSGTWTGVDDPAVLAFIR